MSDRELREVMESHEASLVGELSGASMTAVRAAWVRKAVRRARLRRAAATVAASVAAASVVGVGAWAAPAWFDRAVPAPAASPSGSPHPSASSAPPATPSATASSVPTPTPLFDEAALTALVDDLDATLYPVGLAPMSDAVWSEIDSTWVLAGYAPVRVESAGDDTWEPVELGPRLVLALSPSGEAFAVTEVVSDPYVEVTSWTPGEVVATVQTYDDSDPAQALGAMSLNLLTGEMTAAEPAASSEITTLSLHTWHQRQSAPFAARGGALECLPLDGMQAGALVFCHDEQSGFDPWVDAYASLDPFVAKVVDPDARTVEQLYQLDDDDVWPREATVGPDGRVVVVGWPSDMWRESSEWEGTPTVGLVSSTGIDTWGPMDAVAGVDQCGLSPHAVSVTGGLWILCGFSHEAAPVDVVFVTEDRVPSTAVRALSPVVASRSVEWIAPASG